MEKILLSLKDGSRMDAFVFRPEGPSRGGLIVLQEAFGVNAHIRDVAGRYAKEGYLVIAPELFHRTTPGFESEYVEKKGVAEQMGALTDEGLLADIEAAHAWLVGEFVGKIGIVGYCMGGRAAFLANASLPFAFAISYYGGRIASTLLQKAASQHGPLLMFWGGRDTHIPAEDKNVIASALVSADKAYTNVEFSYAEHGFFCDARASYSENAARQAWALTLQFIEDATRG